MHEDETPFARVPPPGITEPPSPYVPEGEIAFYGAFARGVRSRPRMVRAAVVLLVLLPFLAVTFLLFRSDAPGGRPPPAPPSQPSSPLPTSPPLPTSTPLSTAPG